jgi:hypothetical protein
VKRVVVASKLRTLCPLRSRRTSASPPAAAAEAVSPSARDSLRETR